MTQEASKRNRRPLRAEPQINPELCRFVSEESGAEFYGGSTHLCASATAAQGSPLLEALFAIPGVTQALVSGDSVILQKSGDRSWTEMGPEVGAVLRAHLDSGRRFAPPVPETGSKGGSRADALLSAKVQEVLDRQINPGVAGHGGKIELVEIQGSRAIMKMSGGCQGCGAAKVTLKQGVEKALLAQFPEISEVVDITDHSAGQNPYYAR